MCRFGGSETKKTLDPITKDQIEGPEVIEDRIDRLCEIGPRWIHPDRRDLAAYLIFKIIATEQRKAFYMEGHRSTYQTCRKDLEACRRLAYVKKQNLLREGLLRASGNQNLIRFPEGFESLGKELKRFCDRWKRILPAEIEGERVFAEWKVSESLTIPLKTEYDEELTRLRQCLATMTKGMNFRETAYLFQLFKIVVEPGKFGTWGPPNTGTVIGKNDAISYLSEFIDDLRIEGLTYKVSRLKSRFTRDLKESYGMGDFWKESQWTPEPVWGKWRPPGSPIRGYRGPFCDPEVSTPIYFGMVWA